MKPLKTIGFYCLFLSALSISMRAEANWKKHGPIEVTSNGYLQVFVQQWDSKNLEIKLLDADGNEVQVSYPEGHFAAFYNLNPGIYFINVQTDGFEEMIVHSSFVSNNRYQGHSTK